MRQLKETRKQHLHLRLQRWEQHYQGIERTDYRLLFNILLLVRYRVVLDSVLLQQLLYYLAILLDEIVPWEFQNQLFQQSEHQSGQLLCIPQLVNQLKQRAQVRPNLRI